MSNIEIKKSRLAFIYFCILEAFLAIIISMIFIVAFGDKVKVSGIYDPRLAGRRANIYDRNDVLVATDLKTKSLYVSSVLVKDPKAIAQGFVEDS
jgi:cell division protein FtsI/penicillin-binding protein 2